MAYMGTTEWLIVAGLAIVLFGGAKIPQLARGLGEGIREFKKSVNNDEPEAEEIEEKPKKKAVATTARSEDE